MLEINIHIIKIFLFSSAIQLIFLTFIIFTNKTSNKYFTAILIILSLFTISSHALPLFIDSIYHPLPCILDQIMFLPGPIFYLYFKTFFLDNKINIKHSLHFIPFFIFTLSATLLPGHISVWPGMPSFSLSSASFAIIYHCIYFIFILKLLKKNLPKKDKRLSFWLHFYIYGIFFIWIFKSTSIIILDMFRLFWNDLYYEYDQIIDPVMGGFFIVVSLYVYFVIYTVFSQKKLYIKEIKYKYSQLTQKLKNKYKEKLEDYINNQKVYLDPDINLRNLAKNLSILPHDLSRIINEEYKLNFNDFINKYRIEHSKNLLQDLSGNKTIIEILFSSGFNSKSTFNTAFKKYTGMTPKNFRQLYINCK